MDPVFCFFGFEWNCPTPNRTGRQFEVLLLQFLFEQQQQQPWPGGLLHYLFCAPVVFCFWTGKQSEGLVTSQVDFRSVLYMELPWTSIQKLVATGPECGGTDSFGLASICPCYSSALQATLASSGLLARIIIINFKMLVVI